MRRALSADPPATPPAEARERARLRPVLAADPAGIAELVQEIEQIGEVDLALIGLVPAGNIGDLHMRVAAPEVPRVLREVALGDLAVIEIELQPDIWALDAIEKADRRLRRSEEIAGIVARIERLDQQCDARRRGAIGGAL